MYIYVYIYVNKHDTSFRQIIENAIGKIWTYSGNIQYKAYGIEQKGRKITIAD